MSDGKCGRLNLLTRDYAAPVGREQRMRAQTVVGGTSWARPHFSPAAQRALLMLCLGTAEGCAQRTTDAAMACAGERRCM